MGVMQTDWGFEPAGRAQSPTHQRERGLAALATRQHGTVSYQQVLELGFSASAIARMLANGRLSRLHRGVYAVGHGALHRLARWKAATLAGGPEARLSHRSATALWGCVAPGASRIDISVPADSDGGRRLPELRVHRRGVLLSRDGTEREGIPVTSLARTLLDFASTKARPATLLEACEQSVTLGLFDLAAFADLLDRSRGQRGTRRLCAALEQLTDDPGLLRSELERRLRSLVLSSSLPSPLVNHHVTGTGRLHEGDLVWRVMRFGWTDGVHRPAWTIARLVGAVGT